MDPVFITVYIIVVIFCIMALTGAPFVPSRKREIKEAFQKLYKLSSKDFLIDMGSGNGKVLSIASRFGADSLGLELNPFLVFYSGIRLWRNKKATVKCADMFHFDFPKQTTVIYIFGVGRDGAKFLEAIQKQANQLHKTLYIISYATPIKNLKPIKTHKAYYLFKVEEKK